MKKSSMSRALLAVICMGCGIVAQAVVKMPPVISDHMVLQRDAKVPIWGMAAAGEAVTVSFAGQKKAATADATGKWMVTLDPMPVCAEARVMTIESSVKDAKLEITDILVGEVWVGSGQSNMAGGAGGYAKNDPVLAANIAAAPYPKLRLCRTSQPWNTATSNSVASYSALLFSFGVRLQKELDIPVGLMVGAVGGTPSGYWLSQEAYASDQACKDVAAESLKKYNRDAAIKSYEASLEKWKKDIEKAKQAGDKRLPREPAKPVNPGECRGKVGNLYEAHIRPYLPYAIRGVLWDQGESGTAIEGVDQYTLMGALIRGWRKEWNQDFAFIYVQKPSGGGCALEDTDPVTAKAEKLLPLPAAVADKGEYRELHIRIMNYPNTFMAISSDLGPGVHPVNKAGYGTRSARVALGAVYGKPVEIYGPIYKSLKIQEGKVIVSFDHVGKGLTCKKGASVEKLQGFAIAGDDGKFVWADALIEGDTVVLSSTTVTKPVAVRYAWAAQHPWANLFNKDGLPAIPFRADASAK
jgi:sialate O-acetylesterase